MRKENNQNVIIGILGTLVLVVAILVILTMNGTISFGKNDNEVIDNEIIEKESNQSENDIDSTIEAEKKENIKYDESSFIRQTQINLVDEPNCTGNLSSLVANIEENGNISISQNGGASIVTPGKAKYLFKVGKLACDVVSLYYITDNNELYVLDNPRADIDQTATKVINDEVIEFLGTETKEVEDGYNHYIKVLLKNNTVKYVNYITTVK